MCGSCKCFYLQSGTKQLAECVDLLLQLDEPAEDLCEEFLSQYVTAVHSDLSRNVFAIKSVAFLSSDFFQSAFTSRVFTLLLYCIMDQINLIVRLHNSIRLLLKWSIKMQLNYKHKFFSATIL